MVYSNIVRILRDYGPVEGDFVAARLGMSMTETRPYLDTLEREGLIQRRGHVVMLVGETRSSAHSSTRVH